MRNLILVLGDQLDGNSAAFDGFQRKFDSVWMAEVPHEAEHVWCHQFRIAMFLSAMRHFRNDLQADGRTVEYREMAASRDLDAGQTFAELLSLDLARLQPERLVVVQPGDWRVLQELRQLAADQAIELDVREDRHFYCSLAEFSEYAAGRKSLRLEFFYRLLRKQHNVLIEGDGQPVGGQWNFDHDNRASYPAAGPQELVAPLRFPPDDLTQEVLKLVSSRFSEHPGRLNHFEMPVNRHQAKQFLNNFVSGQLPEFGRYEDAMWRDEAFLNHSRLSALLNLKLLDPRDCVGAAVAAWQSGDAPLNSVEGFVRQVLGWREFVRGIYWIHMPEYAEHNHLKHEASMPAFFWDGQTDMECVRQSMQHVLNHAYAHHIHRLMVLGNFALLWGVHPYAFHEWHMAMYADAVDWVSLPNTLGMSQFGDGGIVGSKPYVSGGNYINKMSNFCGDCRFNYRKRVGDDACPFTTMYWEFLDRHHGRLKDNARMKLPIRNLEKMRREGSAELSAIRARAQELRQMWGKQAGTD